MTALVNKSSRLCAQMGWQGALGSGVALPGMKPQRASWKWAYESQFHRGNGDTLLPCQDEI